MANIYNSGLEVNTKELERVKVKRLKHKKWCDKKTKSESTAHFVFIGCDCQRQNIKIEDEPNTEN